MVGIAHSRNKKPFFSIDERVDIAREVLGHYPNVEVQSFGGLLKDFVRDGAGASSCAACAPCPTSNTNSRWPA